MIMDSGKLKWHIACDESGTDGAKYYGFGSLWMKWQRRGDFTREINQLRKFHNFDREIKWKKSHDRKYFNFYEDLIDYFFKKNWLAFHCILIRKSIVNKDFHEGDYDLARRKHFNELITNKIGNVLKAHRNRECEFRVDVDPIASRYKKADEEFHIIANHKLKKSYGIDKAIGTVITKDSKNSEQIQISDFFLGAVLSAWQGKASSPQKMKIQRLISNYIGWPHLNFDTYPSARKFNIWYFYDRSLGPREVEPRNVSLRYPLPTRRT